MRKVLPVLGLLLGLAILIKLLQPATIGIQDSSERFIQGDTSISGAYHDAIFALKIPDVFTAVTKVKITVITRPLESTVELASFGVGHTPSVVDPFYMFYVRESSNYPSDMTLKIDSVDYTSALGGPWNPGAGNSPVNTTLDITRYIVNAPGNLYQTHELVFRAGYKVANSAVPSHPNILGNTSNGYIEIRTLFLGFVGDESR